MVWAIVIYFFTGILLMALSVPLIQRRIEPNPLYGFRVPKTLGDRDIWFAANEYSGRQLFIAGAVTSVAALIMARSTGIPDVMRVLACVAVLLTSILVALVRSLAFLKTL